MRNLNGIETPKLAVDVCISTPEGFVFIKRKNPPEGLAFVGGFVDIGETVEEAVIRETKEETGLEIKKDNITFIAFSDKPDRDPRGHVVSFLYMVTATGKPVAGSDAKEIVIYKELEEVPQNELVFDHANMINIIIN